MKKTYACPCCGYKTLDEAPPGTFAICSICDWEDDGAQYEDPDYDGGANDLSLREAQKKFREAEKNDRTRQPSSGEQRDPSWSFLKALALLALASTALAAPAVAPLTGKPAPPPLQELERGPERLILDTDTAYFHDDGAALVMLLRRRDKISLAGVTVTAGNEHARQGAEYMLHIMELLGAEDVPLYVGSTEPLKNSRERAAAMGKKWKVGFKGALGSEPPAPGKLAPPHGGAFAGLRPRPGDAVDFLIETIEREPGRVTVLAIGPMTNIARALAKKPAIARKIRRLVFMGGSAREPGNVTSTAEFNFWFDPEAARAVLRSDIPEKIMFGLDITNKAPLRKADFDEIVAAKTPLTALYADGLGNQWPGFNKKPDKVSYFWDCLPVAWLLDPGVVTRSEVLALDVDDDHRTEGYGKVLAGAESGRPVKVMLDLDRPRFWALYKGLLTAPFK